MQKQVPSPEAHSMEKQDNPVAEFLSSPPSDASGYVFSLNGDPTTYPMDLQAYFQCIGRSRYALGDQRQHNGLWLLNTDEYDRVAPFVPDEAAVRRGFRVLQEKREESPHIGLFYPDDHVFSAKDIKDHPYYPWLAGKTKRDHENFHDTAMELWSKSSDRRAKFSDFVVLGNIRLYLSDRLEPSSRNPSWLGLIGEAYGLNHPAMLLQTYHWYTDKDLFEWQTYCLHRCIKVIDPFPDVPPESDSDLD